MANASDSARETIRKGSAVVGSNLHGFTAVTFRKSYGLTGIESVFFLIPANNLGGPLAELVSESRWVP